MALKTSLSSFTIVRIKTGFILLIVSKVTKEGFQFEIILLNLLRERSYIAPFVGFTEEPSLLIFKYVPVCFSDVLQNASNVSMHWLVKIARDIACGMQDIHANNIVHFDLKPGKNVF